MAASKLVIVESPAKAKTINKYLGNDYHVIASFGHIRDLVQKDGSVDPNQGFNMLWESNDRSSRAVNDIVKASRESQDIYLASDPDREGEAIAWHVSEVLKERGLADKKNIQRVTFNEITKSAVQQALAHPRKLNQELIDAYMARRALDYLVGYTLSPVLWRKLPGSKSAGRVQSVALRLICEREREIEKFIAQEYWTIESVFKNSGGQNFNARLTHLEGKKLDKFALGNAEVAQNAVTLLKDLDYQVASIEKKQIRRNPDPPFTTSTLQQEASRKLGFGASRTMRIAQSLYEGVELGGETVGLITYMRTDGVTLSQEAIAGARDTIKKEWGDKYLPDQPRIYKSQAKNAQEAHEAIRPTSLSRSPDVVSRHLDGDALRLYTLIWQRTLASQMSSALLDQVSADLASTDNKGIFRATGTTVVFDGYQRVYQETSDDDAAAEPNENMLPVLREGEHPKKQSITPHQHHTQPPPRFSEASLVKRLEELGIGRPSTYASIMQVLQDRSYVRLDKKRFFPEDRGRIVTHFLENYFRHYVEYDFTADLENKLDEISDGKIDWKKVLSDFWGDFSNAVGATKDLTITEVLDALDAEMGDHLFPKREDSADPRLCPQCGTGRLGLKLGKFGAFIGCSNYPECKNTRPLTVSDGQDNALADGPRELGDDPATGLPVSVRVGPYGAYVQLGPKAGATEQPEKTEEPETKPKKRKKGEKADKADKPKRVSLLKNMDPLTLDFDTALKLLSLPRDIGTHPENGEKITASVGRFGPYIKCGAQYKSIPVDDDLLTIGLNRAVVLLAEPSRGRGGTASTPAKELGEHPSGGKITQHSGRFGPYVKHGKVMATITKSYDPENLSLEQAIELVDAKAAKSDSGKKTTAKKTPAKKEKPIAAPKEKKPAAKKAPTKKAAPKKTAAKKTATKK